MQASTIREFCAFGSKQHRLLEELFALGDGAVSHDRLRSIIHQYRNLEDLSAASVENRLRELRIVERDSGINGEHVFRYADAVSALHRHLSYESEPVSADSLQGCVKDLGKLSKQLKTALEERDRQQALHVLEQGRRLWRQIRFGVEKNHEHVSTVASEVKVSGRKLSASERYKKLLWDWERYIAPLCEMVDLGRAASAVFEEFEETVLMATRHGCVADSSIPETTHLEIRISMQHTIERLRDCSRSISPLLNELRMGSLAAEGAAVGLAHVLKNGFGGMDGLVRISMIGVRELYTNEEVLADAQAWVHVQPSVPQPIDLAFAAPAGRKRGEIDGLKWRMEAIARMREAVPVPDVLEFLVGMEDATADQAVRVLHEIGASSDDLALRFSGTEPKVYEFPDKNVRAYSVEVVRNE